MALHHHKVFRIIFGVSLLVFFLRLLPILLYPFGVKGYLYLWMDGTIGISTYICILIISLFLLHALTRVKTLPVRLSLYGMYCIVVYFTFIVFLIIHEPKIIDPFRSRTFHLKDNYYLQEDHPLLFSYGHISGYITEKKFLVFESEKSTKLFLSGIQEISIKDYKKGSFIILDLKVKENGVICSGKNEMEISLNKKVWDLMKSYKFSPTFKNGLAYLERSKRFVDYDGQFVKPEAENVRINR